MRYAPKLSTRSKRKEIRRPAMKKSSTALSQGKRNCAERLTIGLDLGDRWSYYCVLDGKGEVLVEQKLATTPKP